MIGRSAAERLLILRLEGAVRKAAPCNSDGMRGLYRHTRQAAHHSVMELHPLQSVMGGVGLKKRHRSARSLVTLEKRHRSARSLAL